MRSWTWWRARALELGIAIVIAGGVIEVSRAIQQQRMELVPASSWLRVNEVYVPNHTTVENPQIIYDRVVLTEFEGFWIVELQKRAGGGLWATVCSGSGVNAYDPTEIIEKNLVSWETFVGHPCPRVAGDYRLRVTYTLTRPGWPPKRVLALSNDFTVSES